MPRVAIYNEGGAVLRIEDEFCLNKYYETRILDVFYKLDKNIKIGDIEELVKNIEIRIGKELNIKEIIYVYKLQNDYLKEVI